MFPPTRLPRAQRIHQVLVHAGVAVEKRCEEDTVPRFENMERNRGRRKGNYAEREDWELNLRARAVEPLMWSRERNRRPRKGAHRIRGWCSVDMPKWEIW